MSAVQSAQLHPDLTKIFVGQRVLCYSINNVKGISDDGWRGFVTQKESSNRFRWMPDLPDPTSNGIGDARNFSPQFGWEVGIHDLWQPDDFLIEEIP